MGSTQNLAALGQSNASNINGNSAPLRTNGIRPPVPYTSSHPATTNNAPITNNLGYPMSSNAPANTQQNYSPRPTSNYPAASTQQNYPPQQQNYLPPQQSYPPLPQQGYPPLPKQNYPPIPQQGYPPPPRQSYPSQQPITPTSSSMPPPNQVPYNSGYPGKLNGPPQSTPGAQWALPPTQGQPQAPPTDGTRPPQTGYPGPAGQLSNQYPNFNPAVNQMTNQMNTLSVTQSGFDKLWGHEHVDLMQVRQILPAQEVETPRIRLKQEHLNSVHCSPDIFRCTLTKIPESSSILQKSRLPLGILIHPFKDLPQLPVVQCHTIVRCRSCRTYINPFVYFVDQRRWKCNLCFRVNDLPEEFQFDPMSQTYGDPTRRPEIKNATIEFIAPAEYMLRPPQPPIYLYLLDVSHAAVETGYLKLFTDILLDELEKVPGDKRTQIGFITYDSCVHFYKLAEGLNQPHQLVVTDIDDIFLPCPNDLLVNLHENKRLVIELLEQLALKFTSTPESDSALGAALQAAYKLISPTGGRITVFQANLPNIGPGALKSREDPNQRASKEVPNLNPATDFYKTFALDCSGQQVAVDLFLLGGQYMDIASLACVSKYSGGCINHFPSFHYIHNLLQVERLEHALRRYLIRKIGFESVMRIRCTHGLSIHTFHGNFFVRSTDLLALPNINPDAGFGFQVSVDESLTDVQNICFQAALLYTSSKGERRIRVHTMCLPIASTVTEVIQSADQQCIIGLLAKMAVDRSLSSSITDARDALINACVEVISSYKATLGSGVTGLVLPANLRLMPLYVAALLKSVALRTGTSTRLDDRVYAMNQLKVLPLCQLIQSVYPDLYAVHNLNDQGAISQGETVVAQPPRLHLSAEMVDSSGIYMMDTGEVIYLYVGRIVNPAVLQGLLGTSAFASLPEQMYELPELDTQESERLRCFYQHLQNQKPRPAVLQLIREDSKIRQVFLNYLVDGRTESSLSYYEFLQHLKTQVK